MDFKNTLVVSKNISVENALRKLDENHKEGTLFVVDENSRLLGSITDGDIRRGLIKGLSKYDLLIKFINRKPKVILEDAINFDLISVFKQQMIKLVPIVNERSEILSILNLELAQGKIPLDCLILAGGKGERLRPLTNNIPKPLIKVGEKSIIEHNIDRLISFGVENFWISVKYLGDQIIEKLDHYKSQVSINFIEEKEFFGTAGSLSSLKGKTYQDVLMMNSDLLTNINFQKMYDLFKERNADLAVACTTYEKQIPYAVMEINSKEELVDFKEKPIYNHYTNAGIYMIKQYLIDVVPKNTFFDATDLLKQLMDSNQKVISYRMKEYWRDIGKHKDLIEANSDIQNLML